VGRVAVDVEALGLRRAPLDVRDGILVYVAEPEVNWSDELEAIHEQATTDHFMDTYTRRAIVRGVVDALPGGGTAADLGCSSGLLLADLHRARPEAALVGIDLVASGLERAREVAPTATLLLSDATDLPLGDASVNVLAAANLLEHVPDDAAALTEIARVLRPGGRAAIVVPLGPGLYDYYDKALGHERRYAPGSIGKQAARAGLDVVARRSLGSFLYPAFWAVKKRHRRMSPSATADARTLVARDIARTRHSKVGELLCRIEERLPRTPPFGIRELTILTPR